MTNFNFEKMTISELAEMARYYSSHSEDSIARMEKNKSRVSLESAIKYSSKYMAENRKGCFTFSFSSEETAETDEATETATEFDADKYIENTFESIRAQQAKANAERMKKAEEFIDNICGRWAAAYGIDYNNRK